MKKVWIYLIILLMTAIAAAITSSFLFSDIFKKNTRAAVNILRKNPGKDRGIINNEKKAGPMRQEKSEIQANAGQADLGNVPKTSLTEKNAPIGVKDAGKRKETPSSGNLKPSSVTDKASDRQNNETSLMIMGGAVVLGTAEAVNSPQDQPNNMDASKAEIVPEEAPELPYQGQYSKPSSQFQRPDLPAIPEIPAHKD